MIKSQAKSLEQSIINFITIINKEINNIAMQKSNMTLKEISLLIQSADKLFFLQNKLNNIKDLKRMQNEQNKLDKKDKKIIDNYIAAKLRHFE
ncbi:MAG: hypothetical protein EOP33_00075 [Rickettsiaceae bacterium]|nr:MAG: hypothetical protein EOP33_00075 [Rickettsiaceae bacterium]